MAVARAAIYAHDKADLRDLDVAGVRGSAAAAIVEMEGPPESLVHLPAAYLDEILLRDRKRDAEERLFRIRRCFAGALEQFEAQPETALGSINLVASIDDVEPFARIETRLNATFRAATACRPRRRLDDALEAGFWAYWNWLLRRLDLKPDAIRPLLANLHHQFQFYDTHGLHMRHIGAAVRHAIAAGASTRLQVESSPPLLSPQQVQQSALAIAQQVQQIEQIRRCWQALWDERHARPLRSDLLAGIEQYVSGFVTPGILRGDSILGVLRNACVGGYLWRQAERELDLPVDVTPVETVKRVRGAGDADGRDGAVEVASTAMDRLDAWAQAGAGPLFGAMNVLKDAFRYSDVGIGGSNADARRTFIYGYLLAEAEATWTTRP